MIERILQMTRVFASLLALVVVCLPSAADALALWGDSQPTSCLDSGAVEFPELESEPVSVAPEGDCAGIHPDDPSFNTCFEEAEAPISSFPELLAEMRAEKVLAMVAATAIEVSDAMVGASATDVSEEPRELVEIRPLPLDPYNEPECSSYSVRCGAMPSLPTLFSLDAAANGFPVPRVDITYPAFVEWSPDQSLSPRDGPGPADGFGKPLVPPPRMA